jgi:hypothetical protein
MAGSEPRIDPELLGRVASMSRGQQRWLRTIVASVFSMDDAAGDEGAAPPREPKPKRSRAERRPPAPEMAPEPEQTPSSDALEKVLRGEGVSEDEYPELADELQGIADIAELLRESGRERRRFGEELLRLLESSEPSEGAESEDDEEQDEELS